LASRSVRWAARIRGHFPPSGWQLSASPRGSSWNSTTNRAAHRDPRTVSHSPSYRQEPMDRNCAAGASLAGNRNPSFSCYLSSEADFHGLKVWVYDPDGNYVDVLAGPWMPRCSAAPHDFLPSTIGQSSRRQRRWRLHRLRRARRLSQSGPGLDFVAPSSGRLDDIISTDMTSRTGYIAGDYVLDFGGTSAACLCGGHRRAGALAIPHERVRSSTLLRLSCDKMGG